MSKARWTPAFSNDDVTIKQRKRVFDGFFKMDELELTHRSFEGGEITINRELFQRDEAVCLLPYDYIRDEVVMVEQFRIGALDQARSPWLLELIAGIIEPGETVEEVAIREAQEEAGIDVQRLEPVMRYLVSPGGNNEYISILCGQVDSRQAEGIHGLAEEGEDIKVHRIDAETAFEMVQQGIIDNAASIIALQWLQLHRNDLRARWVQDAAHK